MNTPNALLKGLSRLLVIAGAAFASLGTSAAPMVKGEVYLGSPKAEAPLVLLSGEGELPAATLRLSAPAAKDFEAGAAPSLGKRKQVGIGRDVAAHAQEGSGADIAWAKVGDYRIAKVRVSSPGAAAMRVGVSIANASLPVAIRVAGSDDAARVLGSVPLQSTDLYWTPVTEGESQLVEIASPANAPAPRVDILQVSHLVSGAATRFAKTVNQIGGSGSCNIDVACVSNPSQALLQASSAVAHMVFTRIGGGTFVCTGTILNDTDTSSQIPYLYSGNHCFDAESSPFYGSSQMQTVSSTLNSYFFFEAATCGSLSVPNFSQLTGGATFLYNNRPQDVLFLRLNNALPAGAALLGWDANPIASGNAITVLHHPRGDLKKFSRGTMSRAETISFPQDASTGYWRVTYDAGTTEGGSSGAGLLTFNSSISEYQLRGGLWGGEALCTNLTGPDWYSRLDIAYPNLRQWLSPTAGPSLNATDLWWNPAESGWGLNLNHQGNIIFGTLFTYATDGQPLWLVASALALQADGSYSGSLYQLTGTYFGSATWGTPNRFTVGVMTLRFSGTTSATLSYTVNGVGVTKQIQRQVFSTQPACSFTSASRAGATNYQDLWWIPTESGWGINITHQGNILFATLFVYNPGGRDTWYVASALNRQADGSYLGDLYQTTGPVFNASPWGSVGLATVGSMRLRFSGGESGLLTYNVGGTSVSKSIQRQVFATPPTVCQ